jgi:DNA-binding LacI/PurR family transcriptional regulator
MDLSVPEDLSVIGYDDIEISEYLRLTTVKQSLYESGVRGGQLILEMMTSATETPREIALPTELVVRDTSGPAPTDIDSL